MSTRIGADHAQEVTVSDIERRNGFDENEIRCRARGLGLSLAAADPTAWVFDYTEDDALSDAGGHRVQGRAALLEMATGMSSSVRGVHTSAANRGQRDVGPTVWCEASWVSGPPESGTRTEVRGIIVWRKESDDRWRVALEHIA